MAQSKVVSIDELKNNNPTLCLSPNRVFDRCERCEVFIRKYKKLQDITKTINSIKCVPHLNKDKIKLLEKRVRLKQDYDSRIAEIDRLLQN
jgi:hypothetical protein